MHMVLFWSISGLFWYMDSNNKSKKDKLQKTSVEPAELKKCLKRCLFNQFFILLPLLVTTYPLKLSSHGPERMLLKHFPPWNIALMQVAFCVLVEEVLFYYSHRLLHYGPIYQTIHKIHHEFRAPIAMAAIYAHPVEFLLSNLIPVDIGPALAGSHILVAFIWFTIAAIGTLSHHSGYKTFWQVGGLDPTFHDFHHYSFNANFGLLGFLDKLHGTNNPKGFQDYLQNVKQQWPKDSPKYSAKQR